MRIQDLFESTDLNESITFTPTRFDPEHNSHGAPSEKKLTDCPVCDGTGKDYNDESYPCLHCDGKARMERWVSTVPELNVANANARVILQMIGVSDEEDTGTIENKNIPTVVRKLIMLKNSDKKSNEFSREDSIDHPRTVVDKTGDIPRIGKQGPTIYNMGLSPDKINYYIDELLKICQVATNNRYDLSWF